jgi:hypothetical protein
MSPTPPFNDAQAQPPPLSDEMAAAVSDLPAMPRLALVALRGYLVNPRLRGGPEVRAALADTLAELARDADRAVAVLFEAWGGRRELFRHLMSDLDWLLATEPAGTALRSAATDAKAALEMASVGLRRLPPGIVAPAPTPPPAPAALPEPDVSDEDPEAVAEAVLLDGAAGMPRLTDDAVVMAVHNLLRHHRLVGIAVGTPRPELLRVQLIKGVITGAGGPLAGRLRKHPARVEFARRYWGLVSLSARNGRAWPGTAETLADPLDRWPAELSGVVVLVPTPRGAGRPLPTANLPSSVADRGKGRFFGITPLERYMAEVVRVNGRR